MNILIDTARAAMRDTLEIRSMRRHRSLIGRRDAPRYSDYLARCRAAHPGSLPDPGPLREAVEIFRRDGVTGFVTDETTRIAQDVSARIGDALDDGCWAPPEPESGHRNYTGDLWNDFPELRGLFDGPLGLLLTNYFRSSFKILYGTLYHSRPGDARAGSQMWHSDSGPGICVNVMYYLHPCAAENGALEALPWTESLALYIEARRKLRGAVRRLGSEAPRDRRRTLFSDHYTRRIEDDLRGRVIQPVSDQAGLVVPFLNNTLHRGGFPTIGHTRTAIVFHCYPSHLPTDYALYARRGIGKTMPYPKDPAMEF